MPALITKVNKPKVRITKGDRIIFTNGLKQVLISVKIPATTAKLTKSSDILNPGMILPASMRAIRFEKKENMTRDINFIIFIISLLEA